MAGLLVGCSGVKELGSAGPYTFYGVAQVSITAPSQAMFAIVDNRDTNNVILTKPFASSGVFPGVAQLGEELGEAAVIGTVVGAMVEPLEVETKGAVLCSPRCTHHKDCKKRR